MRKKLALPNFKKCLLLVSFVIPLLIGIGFYNEYRSIEQELRQSIKFWEPELSEVYSDQDWLSLRKMGRTLFSQKLSTLSLYSKNELIFSIPQETKNDCLGKISVDIAHYGVQLGAATACVSFRSIISDFFRLKATTATALSILLLALVGAGIPILRFRMSLVQLINLIEEWSIKEIGPLNERFETSGADSSFLSLIKIFEKGVDNRISVEKEVARLTKGKELGEIASQVAHDVKSPLTAIDVVLGRNNSLNSEEKEVVDMAILRMKAIVRELLEKAKENAENPIKLERGAELKSSSNPVKHILSSVIREISTSIDPRKVKIRTRIIKEPGLLPPSVSASDYSRVISNLVSNSIDAVGASGEILITLKKVRGWVYLAVSDNGAGIPTEIIGELGKRRATYGKIGGTGLGLHYVHTRSRKWGGRIKVRSKLGFGTIVRVSIPTNLADFN
jgi:signal transduction histidine kinase